MRAKSLFRVVNPPAAPEDLATLQSRCGILPPSYLAFLAELNGAEWGLHDHDGDCLALWKANEIPELNDAYEIRRWLPDLLVIGSNGGDDAIGFDRAASPEPELWPIVRIGFGNLDRDDFVRVACGFKDWQDREFRLVR